MTPKIGDKFRLFGLLWEIDYPIKDGFRAVHEDKTEFLRVMYLKYEEAEYLDWVQPAAPAVSKLSIDEAAFKREILLEIADCWADYASTYNQGFAKQLRKRAEKL